MAQMGKPPPSTPQLIRRRTVPQQGLPACLGHRWALRNVGIPLVAPLCHSPSASDTLEVPPCVMAWSPQESMQIMGVLTSSTNFFTTMCGLGPSPTACLFSFPTGGPQPRASGVGGSAIRSPQTDNGCSQLAVPEL
jgi:hypothetical protein